MPPFEFLRIATVFISVRGGQKQMETKQKICIVREIELRKFML